MSKSATHIFIPTLSRLTRRYLTEAIFPVVEHLVDIAPIANIDLNLVGHRVRLRFYHPLFVERLLPALAHLIIPATEQDVPELTLFVWDDLATGTTLGSPFAHDYYREMRETNASSQVEDGCFGTFIKEEQAINVYDTQTKRAFFWMHDATELIDWLRAAPFRTIFHWFLSQQHVQLVHSAVFGWNERSVMLTAKGGSGKSTTAISSVLSGMTYTGDDFVAITQNSASITAHSLYQSAKLTDDTMRYFPELKPHVINPNHAPDIKSIIMFKDLIPAEQIRLTTPISALLVPQITNTSETTIAPVSKMEAFLALSPSTTFLLPIAARSQLATLKQFVEKLPCYRLSLGSDVRAVPETIKAFLTEL